MLRWNLVCDERECHLCWLVILKSSSTSTMDLTSKEERSQCHTLNHCWVVSSYKQHTHMYIHILPHVESFLAASNIISSIHYFGSSKGSKARGKHTLVSVVFMHQGVFNSVCPFNCDTQDYLVGLPGRMGQWGIKYKLILKDFWNWQLNVISIRHKGKPYTGTGLSAFRREINVCCK